MSTIKLSFTIAAALCVAGVIALNIMWMNEMEQKRSGEPVSVKRTDRAAPGLRQDERPWTGRNRAEPSALMKPPPAEVPPTNEPQSDAPAGEIKVPAGGTPETSVPGPVSPSAAEETVPPAIHESRGETAPDLTKKTDGAGNRPARGPDGTVIVNIRGQGGQKTPAYRPPRPSPGTGSVIPPLMPQAVKHPTSTAP